MEREGQAHVNPGQQPRPAEAGQGRPESAASAPPSTRTPSVLRQRLLQAAVLGVLAGLCVVGLFFLLRASPQDGHAQGLTAEQPPKGIPLFDKWGKPEVILVLSGQQHGYVQPCGCSKPQFGGLPRRYNFVQSLQQRGWPVVAVDLGDVAQRSGPQKMLKYVKSMEALQLQDYTAVSFGQYEMAMPLLEALAHYTLNSPYPRVVAANLLDRDPNDLYHDLVHSLEIDRSGRTPKVGVVGLIGPSVAHQVNDPSVQFHTDNGKVVQTVLAELKAKSVALTVVLYQGSIKEAKACAEFCASCRKADVTLPRADVILCLSEEEEPPGVPDKAGDSLVVRVGHKGRYVGVVGAFATGQAVPPYEFRYQLVSIGEEFDTPKGKEDTNPVMVLMEEYAREVKRGNFLKEYPQVPHPVQMAFPESKYVGSERCGSCHQHAYEIWEKTAHAHAYKTLEDARHPSLRQYDGECVACHTVGFGYSSGFSDEVKTQKLKNVGCESCHGPGSEHIKRTKDASIHAVINPWKAKPAPAEVANDKEALKRIEDRRHLSMDLFCQKCHDTDNDVRWNFEKWQKIVHMTPRVAAQPAAPVVQPEVAVPPEPRQSGFKLLRGNTREKSP